MKIRPFRGCRYGGSLGDVSDVVAPPYDQISPEMQVRLYAMSPDNIVRVSFPREEPGLDKYREARRVLDRWLAEGVWRTDETPALYPYHQTCTVEGRRLTRTGFVALGEVSDYAEKLVRPHERTHAGPKRDRMALLEATGADTGLLFMLTSDSTGELLEATRPTGPPLVEARDLGGELHQLWRITDQARIHRVQALMASRQAIIADGHHRYETAVEYARLYPAARYKLMAFFALEAPGLTILPNHRLIHNVDGFSWERLLRSAAEWFEVTPLPDPLAFRPTKWTIGVVSGTGAVTLRLRNDAFERIPWPPTTSRAWRELAVSILHEGVLRPLLDITDDKLDAKAHVEYTADQAEAVRLAREGRYQAAFLIASTMPEELRAVVSDGELLPQKSTHFYPKLLDGLVFHPLLGDAGWEDPK